MLDKFDMDLQVFFEKEMHKTQKLSWYKIFKDIAISLNYMHSLKFYHRDIKLENIGLKKNELGYDGVICDFGNSIYIPDESEYIDGKTGTMLYRDPYSHIQKKFYKKGDEYSFGMMIYIICDLYVKTLTYTEYIIELIHPYTIDDLKKIIRYEMSDNTHTNLEKCFKEIVQKIDNKSYIKDIENRKFPENLLDNNQKQPLVNTSPPIYTQLETVRQPAVVPNKEVVVVPSTEVLTKEEVVVVPSTKVVPKRKVVNRDLKGGKKTNKKRRTKKNKKRRTKKNLIK